MHLYSPGHSGCPGCAPSATLINVADTLGKDTIIVNATGCMEITATQYPNTAWRLPYIHSLFENAPAVASGVVNALRAKGNDHTTVAVIAGDGSTYDIGFGSLSGMLERNEDVIYICLHPDEKIILADGSLIKIGDLVESNINAVSGKGGQIQIIESAGVSSCKMGQAAEAVSFDGARFIASKITNVQKKKSPDTLAIISTRAGGKLRLTPEHKVLTDSDMGFVWKRADELKKGDRLICPKKLAISNARPRQSLEEISGLKINPHFAKGVNGTFTTQGAKAFGLVGDLDEDSAYLLGLVASEGSLSSGYGVAFTNKDEELLSIFERIASKRFIGRKINKITQNGVGRLTIAHAGLRFICENLGIKEDASTILSYDDRIIRAFLGGVFDGDGSISAMQNKDGKIHARAGIATVNDQFGTTLRIMLSRLGIAAAKLSGNRHDVITYTIEDAERFIEEVAFRSSRKRDAANIILNECKIGKASRTKYFNQAPKACIRIMHNAIIANNLPCDFIDDNFSEIATGKRGITKNKVISLLPKMQRICTEEEISSLERLCNNEFYFDEVKEVAAQKSDTPFVYDLTIEGTHNFVPAAAGFVVSNCYNNELYANTGVQKSGATPFGANTNTSQVGKMHHGKESNRKPLIEIAAAHGIPYAAQTNIGFLNDLRSKLKKAMAMKGGARVLDVYAPCALGAGFDGSISMQVAKLAVQTRIWPMFEVENGNYKLNFNVKPESKKPVEECLKLQKRFRHLTPEDIVEAQRRTDMYWNHIMKMCGEKTDAELAAPK